MTKDEFINWDMDDGDVRFQGNEYILVKSKGDQDAGIATREEYEHFVVGHAHAYADGEVMRYRSVIGDISEISPMRNDDE